MDCLKWSKEFKRNEDLETTQQKELKRKKKEDRQENKKENELIYPIVIKLSFE
jgi:hypothetical protein